MVTTSETATTLESKSVLVPPDLNDNPSGQSRLLPIPRRIIPAFSHFPLHPGRNFPRGSVSVASDLVPPMFFFLARVQEAKRKGGITGSNERMTESLFTCVPPHARKYCPRAWAPTNLAGISKEDWKRRFSSNFIILFIIIIRLKSLSLIRDICVIWNRSPTWRGTTNVEIGHVGWSGIASELERSKIRGWAQW